MAIPIFVAKEKIDYKPTKKQKEAGQEPLKLKQGDLLPPPIRHSYPIFNMLPAEVRKKVADLSAKEGDKMHWKDAEKWMP